MVNMVLALIFSLTAFAVNPAQTLNLGAYPTGSVPSAVVSTSTLAKHFTLVGGSASGTNSHYYKFVLMGTQTTSSEQYQVTNGSIAYCTPLISSGAINITYGYGTAALAADDTVTAPTGVKLYSGTNGHAIAPFTTNAPFPMGILVKFPSQSFPFIFGTTISTSNFAVWMNCEEQP